MATRTLYYEPNPSKRLYALLIILSILCAVLAIIAVFKWTSNRKLLEKYGQPDFNTLAQNEVEADMFVTGDISLVIDCYAESYSTDSSGAHVSGSEALYYLVPVYQTMPDGTIYIQYFVTYQAKSGNYDIMDKLIAQTWSGSPVTEKFSLRYAQVGKIPQEVQALLYEWMHDKNFYEHGSFIDWCIEYQIFDTTNRHEIASRLTSYMITQTSSFGMGPGAIFICAGLSVSFIGLFLILKLREPSAGAPPDFGADEDYPDDGETGSQSF